MFVSGIADPIAAFLGHGVGAIAMQDTEIEVVVRRQMPHTGDKCLFKLRIPTKPPGYTEVMPPVVLI